VGKYPTIQFFSQSRHCRVTKDAQKCLLSVRIIFYCSIVS